MKKLIVLLLVFVITDSFRGFVSAQGLTAKGVKVGLNLANFSIDNEIKNTDLKMGLAIGGFLTFSFNDKFAIQPEVFYSMKGYKEKKTESGATRKLNVSLNYLEIPILGVFSVQENIKLFAGPSMGFYLNGKIKGEIKGELDGETIDESGTEDIESDIVKSLQFDLVFGGLFSLGQFSVDARYSLGLTNVKGGGDDFKENFIDGKNQVIQLMIGVSF